MATAIGRDNEVGFRMAAGTGGPSGAEHPGVLRPSTSRMIPQRSRIRPYDTRLRIGFPATPPRDTRRPPTNPRDRGSSHAITGTASWLDGLPGPTHAWITLAGLALETSRIRLGTLVSSVTFRLPGPLAISVAQVDQMSAGRVELGFGTGWYPDEHRTGHETADRIAIAKQSPIPSVGMRMSP